MQRDGIFSLAGHDPYRHPKPAVLELKLDDVIRLEFFSLREGGTDKQCIIPNEFGNGPGTFLKPRVISESAIPNRWVGAEIQFQCLPPYVGGYRGEGEFGKQVRSKARVLP